jgi:hypothetical protein
MRFYRWLVVALALSPLGVVAIGCQGERPGEPEDGGPAAVEAPADDKAEIAAAMAELSPDDRAAAQAQGTCPVSDQPLGSMGPPIKVTVEGRDVFVCCEGCVEELKTNFDTYAAELDASAS